MRTVHVDIPDIDYNIQVASALFRDSSAMKQLRTQVSERAALIVTDENVAPLYVADLQEALSQAGAQQTPLITLPAGEKTKTLDHIREVYSHCVEAGLDRSSVICGLGGGVVGDLAGFAAATYMRGVHFLQFPTSLMAFVDSSVGGKVGLDLPEGKNLIGAFYQPGAVFGNVDFLRSLPHRELRCGLAEVVKYSVLFDPDLFELLQKKAADFFQFDPDLFEDVIARCCAWKAEIVKKDAKEKGCRALLNYGHTFAHALEVLLSYSGLNHGEAVSIGMCMAARTAEMLGMASEGLAERQTELLRSLGLPVVLERHDLSADEILQVMYRDKKTQKGKLRLILPREIGKAEIIPDPSETAVCEAIRKLLSE